MLLENRNLGHDHRALPTVAALLALLLGAAGCGGPPAKTANAPAGAALAPPAVLETVGVVGLVPLPVEGFESLPPSERALTYYLARAVIAGRDRAWNRDGGIVLEVRDLLEEVLTHPKGIDVPVRESIRAYLEGLWIHTGNHDRWTGRKFVPAFTPADLRGAAEAAVQGKAEIRLALGETLDAKLARLRPVIFDPKFEPAIAATPAAATGVAGGITTRRSENDRRQEAALRTLRGFLAKGAVFAAPDERAGLASLAAGIEDPASAGFAAWVGGWIAGGKRVDLLTGPEPLAPRVGTGMTGAWCGVVSITDPARERAVAALAAMAGNLLATSPGRADLPTAPPVHASARVLIASVAPGGPASPEAIAYPAAEARGAAGVRTILLTNVGATAGTTIGRRIVATFAPAAQRDALEAARPAAEFAFAALSAVLGGAATTPARGASATLPGSDTARAVLVAARADLLALHHAADPRLVSIGLVDSPATADAILPLYLAEALAGLRDAAADGLIEGIDRRAQHLVLQELLASRAVVRETRDGATEIKVADPSAASGLVARLLERVEEALQAPPRSRGDRDAVAWVARFGARAEPDLVAEIAGRAARAMVPSRVAWLMPDLVPLRDAAGDVIDARVAPATDFTLQMLRYSGKLPFETPR
jgi:dipeptidyl-peptidase-3